MTRSELIAHIAERKPHLCQREIRRGVATLFEEIGDALARGDRVELRGFGAFSVKIREARVGRNPRTGQNCHVSARAVLCFKIGKRFHERLNLQ